MRVAYGRGVETYRSAWEVFTPFTYCACFIVSSCYLRIGRADDSATDAAVTAIARECIRMRYVDFACQPIYFAES